MKTWKRALALVLALVMALSLVALPSFAEGEDEKDTYDVIINYVFANAQSKQAADPWTATVNKGDTLNVTVTSPAVVGYTPSQAQVPFNLAINKDTTVTVTYTPSIVNFTGVHYPQNVNDDNYTQAETEKKTGQTDEYVGASLAKTYDGFYALPYENVKIAADGSTVVEVYYDRNYYLMDFTMNGGYGVEPIYARYGTPIASVGTPVRAATPSPPGRLTSPCPPPCPPRTPPMRPTGPPPMSSTGCSIGRKTPTTPGTAMSSSRRRPPRLALLSAAIPIRTASPTPASPTTTPTPMSPWPVTAPPWSTSTSTAISTR